jgi:hypothetical protein
MSEAPSLAAHPGSDPSFFGGDAGRPASAATAPPNVPPLGSKRSPWIAAALSAFPGLGSVYNGSYARGIAFFLSVVGAMHLANRGNELWGFGIAFIWLFNVIDAYREARLIRAGLANDVAANRKRAVTSPVEGIGLGVLLFLVGLLSTLDVLGYDVDWVFDLWPVILMVAGGWFIAAAILRLRAERSGEETSGLGP